MRPPVVIEHGTRRHMNRGVGLLAGGECAKCSTIHLCDGWNHEVQLHLRQGSSYGRMCQVKMVFVTRQDHRIGWDPFR